MSEQTPKPATLPKFDVERFLHLSRQVVTIGVREEVRVYQLVTGPQGRTRATLRPALASLLAKSPEEWRQVANCFDESCEVEPVERKRWKGILLPLRSVLWKLTPAARTAVVMAVAMSGLGGAVYRLWPKAPVIAMEDPAPSPAPPPPPPPMEAVRILEDKPAKQVEEKSEKPVPIPKQPWLLLCALVSGLCALGIRWLLLPRTLRRWQMKSQREAEAALAKEAREKGQLLRPSYRVEPILPISRSAAEDCATLLGRLADKERGVDLDVLQTMDATMRAGGRFTPVLTPRQAAGEVLVLIDDEERDYPWLSTVLALIELWKRQGVRLSVYTYGNPFPHYLDEYPRTQHESRALSDVAREHGGAALLLISRRLSVEGFAGDVDWTQELAPFPQRAWIDPDPRPKAELRARAKSIAVLEAQRLVRYPLTDEGVAAAVRQLVTEHETAANHTWPALTRCRSEKEQRALRLWATAAALVPDATWDQVLALRAGLPEISQVFAVPDVRPMQRLLEWVRTESGENPEKHIDRLFLPPKFQDELVARLRQEDGGPTKPGSFEQRVHQILLGQLGDAPRASEQQSGRGRLVWELKVAMHQALLDPARAKELLSPFIGTGVESLLGVYVRGERERQKDQPVFSRGTWADLGVMTSQEGRVTPSQLVMGNARLWMGSALAGLGIGILLCMPVLLRIPKVSELLQPKAEKVVERDHPAESHVERVPLPSESVINASPKEDVFSIRHKHDNQLNMGTRLHNPPDIMPSPADPPFSTTESTPLIQGAASSVADLGTERVQEPASESKLTPGAALDKCLDFCGVMERHIPWKTCSARCRQGQDPSEIFFIPPPPLDINESPR